MRQGTDTFVSVGPSTWSAGLAHRRGHWTLERNWWIRKTNLNEGGVETGRGQSTTSHIGWMTGTFPFRVKHEVDYKNILLYIKMLIQAYQCSYLCTRSLLNCCLSQGIWVSSSVYAWCKEKKVISGVTISCDCHDRHTLGRILGMAEFSLVCILHNHLAFGDACKLSS